jgi:hypothetical protein
VALLAATSSPTPTPFGVDNQPTAGRKNNYRRQQHLEDATAEEIKQSQSQNNTTAIAGDQIKKLTHLKHIIKIYYCEGLFSNLTLKSINQTLHMYILPLFSCLFEMLKLLLECRTNVNAFK